MQADIYIISMGLGSAELLTKKAERALAEIELAIGAKRFESLVSVPLFEPKPLVRGTIDFLKANKGKKIGVLVAGDAGFFSLAKAVVNAFGREQVKVFEGISTVQAAFGAICESWEDARLLSAHGRNAENIKQAAEADKFLILCDACNNPKKLIADNKLLMAEFELWVLANLSLENETVHKVSSIEAVPTDALSCIIGIRKQGGE